MKRVGWLFAWHYQTESTLWLSLVAMIGLWFTLATIYYRLIEFTPADSWLQYICINLPFSLYLGWINVATILNIFIVFGGYVTDPSDEAQVSLISTLSTAALIAIAVLVTIVFTYRYGHIQCKCIRKTDENLRIIRRDPAPMMVFVWAAVGIMVKQSEPTIDVTALVSAIVVGVVAVALWLFNIFQIVR